MLGNLATGLFGRGGSRHTTPTMPIYLANLEERIQLVMDGRDLAA